MTAPLARARMRATAAVIFGARDGCTERRAHAAGAATRQAMADATAHLERLLALSERVTTINVPHS